MRLTSGRQQHRKGDVAADSVRVIVRKELADLAVDTPTTSLARPANLSVAGGGGGSTGGTSSSSGLIAVVDMFDAALSTKEVTTAKLQAGDGAVLVEVSTGVEIRAPFLYDWGRFV